MVSQRLTGGFRLSNRRWYPWVFVLLCTVFLLLAYDLGGKQLKMEWVVSVLGGAGGLTTFLYSQHLQETRLFTELFRVFNERYDRLNQRLNELANSARVGVPAAPRAPRLLDDILAIRDRACHARTIPMEVGA